MEYYEWNKERSRWGARRKINGGEELKSVLNCLVAGERMAEYVMWIGQVLKVGRLLFQSGKGRGMRQGKVESRFNSRKAETECSLVLQDKEPEPPRMHKRY